MKHIAVIPARMGSVGFKFKNRKFFSNTANFLDTVPWFEQVIVSTDDPEIRDMARARGYDVHDRPVYLAGPKISIKQVFLSLIEEMDIQVEDILWLFYLPVLYKNLDDFNTCKPIIEKASIDSLTTFVPAKAHPYDCWSYNESKEELTQYVPNDIFRRQDKPQAWEHYHYVTCFKAKALYKLNSELANNGTYPYLLDEKAANNLISVDTPEEYEQWKELQHRKGE